MATHSNILAWEVPWTGEPGGPEFIGSQLDMTEHTHTQLVTVRCKSVDEILSQMFHHSDSLSDKFRAEKFLVLILLLTLCVWLIKFIQSLWGLIYFSVKSKALDVVSRFKYFYPMEYFLKSYWRVQWASQVALVINIPPANTGDIRDLGSVPESEDLLEKGMVTHASVPAWSILWTEEPGVLESMGSQRVGHH